MSHPAPLYAPLRPYPPEDIWQSDPPKFSHVAHLDNGRMVCLIGVAPTYPAEFVIFRIGQWTAFRKYAGDTAVMFTPQAVWAQDFPSAGIAGVCNEIRHRDNRRGQRRRKARRRGAFARGAKDMGAVPRSQAIVHVPRCRCGRSPAPALRPAPPKALQSAAALHSRNKPLLGQFAARRHAHGPVHAGVAQQTAIPCV